MKNFKNILFVVAGLSVAGFAQADNCSVDMPANLIVDCIVTEGAGSEFNKEAALADHAKREAKSDLALSSTASVKN